MHQRQGYDNKVFEPFYESLEGILLDLRTVTMVRLTHRTQRPHTLLMHATRITMMRKRSSSQLQNRTSQITMTVRMRSVFPWHVLYSSRVPSDIQSYGPTINA